MANEWRTVRLPDLGELNRGKSKHRPRNADHLYGGPYPFVQTGDIRASNGFVAKHNQTYSEAGLAQSRLWPKDTLAITIAANIAESALLTYPACFPDSVVGFIADNEKCNIRFVDYLFRQKRRELQNEHVGTGSVQDNINLEILGRLEFKVPCLVEQHAIAHILGTLDDKIELNRKQNETLEEMARALFKAWFVDFEPVRAKLEGRWKRGQSLPGLPAHLYDLFPDRLVESELGEITDRWEIQSVRDIGSIICGKTPSTKVPDYYGDDVPFITIPEMHGNMFALGINKRLSHMGAQSQKNKMLPCGAICVSCIATLGLVTITTEPSQTNQQINSVIPSEEGTTYYWYWVLRNLGGEIKAGGSGGSVLGNLNTGRFSELKVNASTTKLRMIYNSKVETMFSQVIENTCESQTLAQLRDTLLPKLISGELRLPDVEKFLERTHLSPK